MSKLDRITSKTKYLDTLRNGTERRTYSMFAGLLRYRSGYRTCALIEAGGTANLQKRLYLITQMLEGFPCLDYRK